MDTNSGDSWVWELLTQHFSARTLMWLVAIVISLLIIFLCVCIYNAMRGSSVTFWKMSLGERPRGNKKIEDQYDALQQKFKSLNAMSEQTNVVMQLLSFLVAELQSALWDTQLNPADDEDSSNIAQRLCNLIFEAINTSLSTGKDQYHRFGVFVPCDDEHNMILHRYKGFGTSAASNRRLAIGTVRQPGSVAGRCYLRQEQVYIDDVRRESSYTPNPRSKTEYSSLVCTPIHCGSKCVAVLTVDAKKVDAFCKEDLRFMEVFAGMISIVMFRENMAYDNRADREAIS